MKCPETSFVQTVSLAPEPYAVFANDQQFKELKKFCTNQLKFSIFQVDPTFNLGNFSVTTTAYEHLFLIDRKTGKHPSMLGPIFIHQKKEKQTFQIFSDFLVKKEPELRNLCFFGTDGEEALINAFKETCSKAGHLRCSIHFQKNLMEKLKQIGRPIFRFS